MNNNNLKKVILCIGTSKCIGDSLGPLVGESLYKKINSSNIFILGNLKNNITYQNVGIILNKINKNEKDFYVIVIDSALSNKKNIGKIVVCRKKMIIGRALNKPYYSFGNLSIKGIVGENKENFIKNYKELSNVSEKLIIDMSKKISNKILQLINV